MDPNTKQSAYTQASTAYNLAGESLMSFQQVSQIHQHLCAFHVYSHDHSRHVESHHLCSHLRPDFHQCIIYDSEKPDARLIGIEYIVSEATFKTLPTEEQAYWHSHKYEVESGLLQLVPKSMVPNAITDAAEQPAMLELQKTYGKTIHTWAHDKYPDLPLGPPNLMMSYTADGQVDEEMVADRDKRHGLSTKDKRKTREGYLPAYQRDTKADQWEESGKAVKFKRENDVEIKTTKTEAGRGMGM